MQSGLERSLQRDLGKAVPGAHSSTSTNLAVRTREAVNPTDRVRLTSEYVLTGRGNVSLLPYS